MNTFFYTKKKIENDHCRDGAGRALGRGDGGGSSSNLIMGLLIDRIFSFGIFPDVMRNPAFCSINSVATINSSKGVRLSIGALGMMYE